MEVFGIYAEKNLQGTEYLGKYSLATAVIAKGG